MEWLIVCWTLLVLYVFSFSCKEVPSLTRSFFSGGEGECGGDEMSGVLVTPSLGGWNVY